MRGEYFGSAVAAAVLLMAALPAYAQDQDRDRLKSQIDEFLAHLAPSTNGALRWTGSDPIEIRRDGDALVADIDHGRIAVATGELTLERIEIRDTSAKPGEKTVAVALPKAASFKQPDGTETSLTLDAGKVSAVLDADMRHVQEEQVAFEHLRIEQPKSGASVAAGPLALSWKLAAAADGSWQTPVDFDLKGITFAIPQLGQGGIDAITYHGAAAGPQLAAFDKLRDAVAALQAGDDKARQAAMAGLVALLPSLPGTFSTLGGEARLDGLKVQDPKGGALVSLAQAGIKSEVTGLAGASAGLRTTIRYQGLDIAPSLVPENVQPHRLVVDLGIADVEMSALHELLEAAAKMAPNGAPPSPTPEATAQLMGAAGKLTPTLHAYDVAIDTKDVGLDLTGATKGSPLSPNGYEAAGDLVVRGFDAVPALGIGGPLADYLPVLQQLGAADSATGKVKFHLASTMQQQITINGNDVRGWFAADPTLLRPGGPPGPSDYVKQVQQALAGAGVEVAQNGRYDAATAGAVARYQKQNGINISGVLDPATRAKLGLPAPPSPAERQN
jgi:hypothetical protein